MIKFNELIKTARNANGLSVPEIERTTGIGHESYYRLEKGVYNPRNISFMTIALLCHEFNISLETAYEVLYNELIESGWVK